MSALNVWSAREYLEATAILVSVFAVSTIIALLLVVAGVFTVPAAFALGAALTLLFTALAARDWVYDLRQARLSGCL